MHEQSKLLPFVICLLICPSCLVGQTLEFKGKTLVSRKEAQRVFEAFEKSAKIERGSLLRGCQPTPTISRYELAQALERACKQLNQRIYEAQTSWSSSSQSFAPEDGVDDFQDFDHVPTTDNASTKTEKRSCASDVPSDTEAIDAVETAVLNKLMDMDGQKFRGDRPVTRFELYGALGKLGYMANLEVLAFPVDFSDIALNDPRLAHIDVAVMLGLFYRP